MSTSDVRVRVVVTTTRVIDLFVPVDDRAIASGHLDDGELLREWAENWLAEGWSVEDIVSYGKERKQETDYEVDYVELPW